MKIKQKLEELLAGAKNFKDDSLDFLKENLSWKALGFAGFLGLETMLSGGCLPPRARITPPGEKSSQTETYDASKSNLELFNKSTFKRTLNERYKDDLKNTNCVSLYGLTYLFLGEGLKSDIKYGDAPSIELLQLRNRLLSFDAITQPDSITNIFRQVFANYGEGIGRENSFIDKEIPLRAEFILAYEGYHKLDGPGIEYRLDELGQHVFNIGIPKVLSEGDFDIILQFKNLSPMVYSRSTKYFLPEDGSGPLPTDGGVHYAREVVKSTSKDDSKGGGPDEHFKKTGAYELVMREIQGKIEDAVSYDPLKNVVIVPFVFPTGKTDTDSSWEGYKAGFDIWGIIDNPKKEKSSTLDLKATYLVTEQDTLFLDSVSDKIEIPPGSNNNVFHLRKFTDPFYNGEKEGDTTNTTYFFGVRVEDLANKQTIELTKVYNLPNSKNGLFKSEPMIVNENQRDHDSNPETNPFAEIPNFSSKTKFFVGDTVEAWLPIRGMKNLVAGNYQGIINVYLVPKELPRFESIRLGPISTNISFDSLPEPKDLEAEEILRGEDIITSFKIEDSLIKSTTPNKYVITKFEIPKEIKLRGGKQEYTYKPGDYKLVIVASVYDNNMSKKDISRLERTLHIK